MFWVGAIIVAAVAVGFAQAADRAGCSCRSRLDGPGCRSFSIGAALGSILAPLVPSALVGAMILLGMTAYFSGVVQAPITATVIVMEMTASQSLTIPLMATAFLSFALSRLVCRRPLYDALARRFLLLQTIASRSEVLRP